MSRSSRISFISSTSSPARPSSAHINMYVIGAGMARRVNAEAPDKLRVLQLDDLHRQTYHAAVDRGDFPIAVGVYRHIGGVTVLVLAVACRALDPLGLLRRGKPGRHI